MILETYRESLRDVFDVPALVDLLRAVRSSEAARRDGRLPDAVSVRRVAALLLRRQLHLRRGRAPGRAPRAGALGGPGAAQGAARGGGAARAAGSGGNREPGAGAPASRRSARRNIPMRFTTSSSPSATSRKPRCARAPSRTHRCGPGWTSCCSSAAPSGCASPGRSAMPPQKTRPVCGTRSASSCRRAFPPRCSSRSRIRSAI